VTKKPTEWNEKAHSQTSTTLSKDTETLSQDKKTISRETLTLSLDTSRHPMK
jgi:hypothetical protein